MSKDDMTLQARHEALVDLVKDKQAALDTALKEFEALINKMVDTPAAARQAMVQERAGLVAERDALIDELKLLRSRRDEAEIAIYEQRQAQAQAEAAKRGNLVRNANQQLKAILEEQRIFLNNGRAKLTQAETDKKLVEFETQAAKLRAELVILNRDANQAGFALDRAKDEAEEIRKKLAATTWKERVW